LGVEPRVKRWGRPGDQEGGERCDHGDVHGSSNPNAVSGWAEAVPCSPWGAHSRR
jgi:hypothetical protein